MKKVKILGKSIPILVLLLLAGGLVSAVLLTYYGTMSATINVEQALYLESSNVQLTGTYNNVVGLDGWTCADNSVHGKYCSVTMSTLSGKAVIFRADVVNKLQDDINWNRLITVERTSGSMVAGEAFIIYAYPANWNTESASTSFIGPIDGCWHNLGTTTDDYFRTAVGNELPKVTVGAYDSWTASPVGGYALCIEGKESTTINGGKLTWDGGTEPAYGIGRCGIDIDTTDYIGCMPTGGNYSNPVSYDRPSYIIVEFPLNTVGSYIVNFHMVPITTV